MRLIRFSQRQQLAASHEDPRDPGVVKRVLLDKHVKIRGNIQMVNWATLLPRRSFRAHYHEDMLEIFVMIDDGISTVMDGKKWRLASGDVLIVHPGEIHELGNTTDKKLAYLVIGVSGDTNKKSVTV